MHHKHFRTSCRQSRNVSETLCCNVLEMLTLVLLNKSRCQQPRPLLFFSQSDYFIQIGDTNSHTKWQSVQIQISWLLQKKPTDLDLHCLQRQGISVFSRTMVKKLSDVTLLHCFTVQTVHLRWYDEHNVHGDYYD